MRVTTVDLRIALKLAGTQSTELIAYFEWRCPELLCIGGNRRAQAVDRSDRADGEACVRYRRRRTDAPFQAARIGTLAGTGSAERNFFGHGFDRLDGEFPVRR